MGMFNDVEFLGGFIVDTVTNALMEPTAAIPVLEAGLQPKTSVALYTGPRPLYITNVQVVFADVAVTDPGEDVYFGWAVYSASAGGTSPSYTSLKGYTAATDLPLIVDDSVSNSTVQAVVNVPVDLFNYVGATRDSPDVLYATQAVMPSASGVPPIRVAANSLFQVRIGTYDASATLLAVTGLDDVGIFVYGKRV